MLSALLTGSNKQNKQKKEHKYNEDKNCVVQVNNKPKHIIRQVKYEIDCLQ